MALLLVQVGLPLALLALLASPALSKGAKALQAIAAVEGLLVAQLAGLWLDLSRYAPWLLWALFLPCAWRGLRDLSGRKQQSRRPSLAVVAAGGLALALAWPTYLAIRGRVAPPGEVARLAPPLGPGRYQVVNGGNAGLLNAHLETLRPSTARQARYRGQSYGVDIVGLTPAGRATYGWRPSDPARYAIFGAPVIARCSGRVLSRSDGHPDMPVPEVDTRIMKGNHVMLDCGAFHVLLAHLRRGTVQVAVGQQVHIGDRLGEVGNSGNSMPHLHIHAQRAGKISAPFAAEPVLVRIGGRYLVRGDWL